MSALAYTKPLPRVDAVSRPFWEACAAGELRLQQCLDCGHWWFPPAALCPSCLGERYEWRACSGAATLWSWIVMHQPYIEGFVGELPYNVGLVLLDEGPRLMSTIVECGPAQLRCGARLEVTFERATDEIVLPKFRPAPQLEV